MEGERILRTLKASKSWETTCKDTQNYVGPFLNEDLASSRKRLLEYEQFAYKLLKLCVTDLRKEKISIEKVLEVGQVCVGCLEKCTSQSCNRSSLNFEKLLLHLADGCRVRGHIKECVKTCKLLQDRLSSDEEDQALLLRHTFDVLWQASPLRQLPSSCGPGARITGPVLDQLSDLVYLDLPVADLCLPKPRPVVGKEGAGHWCKEQLVLGEAAISLAQGLAQRRCYPQACVVQEIACKALLRYCCQDNDPAIILQRTQEANLIGRFQYLVRVCRKLHDASTSLAVLQRVLDMLPVQLKGSEVTGAIYEELARTHLQLALSSTTSCVETGGDQQWAGSGCESDVVLKMATELCLDGCEDSYMESWSDAARSLVQSVEGWEWVWSVVEKSSLPWSEFFHKPAAMLEDIYLTALVAAVYGLSSQVLRACQVLLRLLARATGVMSEGDLLSLRKKVQVLRMEVLIEEGRAMEEEEEEEENVETHNISSHPSLAEIDLQLVKVKVQLALGKSLDCESELLYIIDRLQSASCDCHQDNHCHGYCPQSLLTAATAKLLSAEVLLHSKAVAAKVPPSSELSWIPTPVELAHSAMKILWKMFDSTGGRGDSSLSNTHNSQLVWAVLLALLRTMKWVCHLYLVQGCWEKAFSYLREGTVLTKMLGLGPWYCEFLLLLGNMLVTRGNSAPSLFVVRQLSHLLSCSNFVDHMSSPDVAPPTKDFLIARASESVAGGASLCVGLRCRTVLLAGQGLLLKAGHEICHMTHLLTALTVASEILSTHSQNQLPHLTNPGQKKFKGHASKNRSRECNTKNGSLCLTKIALTNLDVACLRAELHLLLWESDEALGLVNDLLPGLEEVWFCADRVSLRLLWSRLLFLKGKSLSQKINGCQQKLASQEVWLAPSPIVRECASIFGRCYDICLPLCPAVLLREVCLWLAFLTRKTDQSLHFLNTAQQISLCHASTYIHGNKIQKLSDEGQRSSIWKILQTHVQDIRSSLCDSSKPLPPDAPSEHLLRARALVANFPLPSDQLLARLPGNWMLLTMVLSPKPHPSIPSRLLVVQATPPTSSKPSRGRGKKRDAVKGVVSSHQVGVEGEVEEKVGGVMDVLRESNESLALLDKKAWWASRRRLDKKLEACLVALGDMAPRKLVGSGDGPVLLVLGEGLHHVPWEVLSFLEGVATTRTPSLTFAAAHLAMLKEKVDTSGVWPMNIGSAYYVLNPQGDLKKTQELFSKKFSDQVGWEGVVGAPPTSQDLKEALENKSLYIYCGHGSGCVLSDTSLQALSRCSMAWLMGCRSVQLKPQGSWDSSGHVYSYLQAGCPAVVGCLWTVTDGDLDKFCDGLVTSVLSTDAALLCCHVGGARSKCRLARLVGASVVVYGLPCQ